jgi:hypothetical protein
VIGMYGRACLEAAFWTCIMQVFRDLHHKYIVVSVQATSQAYIESHMQRRYYRHT